MKPFIAVSMEVLESLEKIMQSGLRGTHLLFSNRMIREAFDKEVSADMLSDRDLADQVQEVLADLVEIDNLVERQDYIEALDKDVRDLLVRLYFGFLDELVGKESSPEVFH